MLQAMHLPANLGRRWSGVQISPPRPTLSTSCSLKRAILALLVVAPLLQVCGCKGSPTAPTMAQEPAQAPRQGAPAGLLPSSFDAAAVASSLPGVDPEYVRLLVYTTVTNTAAPGQPRELQRWPAGVPMRHCAGAGVPEDVVEAAAALVAGLTGIPRAEAGPCTVEWAIDGTISGTGVTETLSPGHVRLVFHNEGGLRYGALHELGHVLGLGHSPRPSDLMYYLGRADALTMSGDEAAVLRLMYGH
jgi:hypothetical protein